MLKILSAALAASLLTGCAGLAEIAGRDPRDAPWDPKHPKAMFDQIPAWHDQAWRDCCGWRTDCEEKKLSRRC